MNTTVKDSQILFNYLSVPLGGGVLQFMKVSSHDSATPMFGCSSYL